MPRSTPTAPASSRSARPVAHGSSSRSAPPLAHAFLALGDADEPLARSPRRPAAIAASLAAMVVLALSAPVAWATASTHKDQPAATAASKAAVAAPDDDGADGGA